MRGNRPNCRCHAGYRSYSIAVGRRQWRDETWWTSGATLRLLYRSMSPIRRRRMRVLLADAGSELRPNSRYQSGGVCSRAKPATAQATDRFFRWFRFFFLAFAGLNVLVLPGGWRFGDPRIPTYLMPSCCAIMNIASILHGAVIWMLRRLNLQRISRWSIAAREMPKGPADRRTKAAFRGEPSRCWAQKFFPPPPPPFDQPLFILNAN